MSIFHGGKGKSFEPQQIIRAADLNSRLNGFGYSLSSGIDIDNNGYNGMGMPHVT